MSEFGYGNFFPMKLKSEAGYALQELIQDVGIPYHIHTDGAKEMTMGNWKQLCQEAGIKHRKLKWIHLGRIAQKLKLGNSKSM